MLLVDGWRGSIWGSGVVVDLDSYDDEAMEGVCSRCRNQAGSSDRTLAYIGLCVNKLA